MNDDSLLRCEYEWIVHTKLSSRLITQMLDTSCELICRFAAICARLMGASSTFCEFFFVESCGFIIHSNCSHKSLMSFSDFSVDTSCKMAPIASYKSSLLSKSSTPLTSTPVESNKIIGKSEAKRLNVEKLCLTFNVLLHFVVNWRKLLFQ